MTNENIKIWSLAEWPLLANQLRRPYQSDYYAFYSSLWDGVVTDPVLMNIPLDDHMVHRGDGVFEAFKCVYGALYNLGAHLNRLENSAASLSLEWPCSRQDLTQRICATVKAGGQLNSMVRVFLSRGPGGFSVNPYECPMPQIYIVVSRLGRPFMDVHPEGARIKTSEIPAKAAYLATIKNCNYVPNVLMKKEAIDTGVDYVVGYDENGHLTESATENVGIVTKDGRLVFPRPGGVLPGTTMTRVMQLAERLVEDGVLRRVEFGDIRRAEVLDAEEILVTGTTVNVAAGVTYDGQPVGAGKPGRIQDALAVLLKEDMRTNAGLREKIF